MAKKIDLQDHLNKLNEIGIALSSELNLNLLLDRILQEARNFTLAEAGSLYLVEGDGLRFTVTQNDDLSRRHGKGNTNIGFRAALIPLTRSSLAGYVGSTGETLNLADSYAIPPDRPYKFNKDFDEKNQYRTKSQLLVPMKDPGGAVLGVLCLINARGDDGEVVPFVKHIERLVLSLASQAAVAVRNARLTEALKFAYMDTIMRLSVAAEYRDEDTASHLHRMSNYSALVARNIGFTEVEAENLKFAAPMHDIGKIGIPDAILQKRGKLTPEEFEVMKTHALIGAKILANSTAEVLRRSEEIALTHHEKFDGTGYPKGLKGDDIPMVGKIVAVADVFDALTSRRCYKEPWPVEKAVALMLEQRGKHFDARCVDGLVACLEECLAIKAKYSE